MSDVKPSIQAIEEALARGDLPEFRPGDTVRVHVRIKEGDKERVQVFEGVVTRIHRGGGARATFTVRKVSYGVGVERIFPLRSPRIQTIELVQRGKVRQARLYYLRGRAGKAARIEAQGREAQGREARAGEEGAESGQPAASEPAASE